MADEAPDEEDVSRETVSEDPTPEEIDAGDVVESEAESAEADLVDIIADVRKIAEEALAQCTELRAMIQQGVIDEAPETSIAEVDPESLTLEDILAETE